MIRYFVLALAVAPLTISSHCNPVKFPVVHLSPSAITFAPQLVNPGGSASAPQAVTLTNTGTADLMITSIESSGDFSQANDCPLDPNPIAAAGISGGVDRK